MRNMPLVSIITPFYNSSPAFMRDAIESILRQDFTEWELLLVDDGSTNDSSVLAREYAETYRDRIYYLEHPGHINRGKSVSRNLGIRRAAGQYVAFLDADDVWLPQTLGEQVALLDAHPSVAMLYGNTEYWYSWTGKHADTRRDFVPALGVPSNTLFRPPTLVPLFLEGRAAVPCICGLLVRRRAVEELGGFEEAFPNLYEDQVFYFKICLHARVLTSGRCWGRYRQHPEASTQQAARNGQAERARLAFLDWLEGYMREGQIHNLEVRQALRRQMWLDRAPDWQGRAARTRRWVRWVKKWVLRLEQLFLPTTLRRWVWLRGDAYG
jgi:glycosyltransferase involved in cell wall biosynthesis